MADMIDLGVGEFGGFFGLDLGQTNLLIVSIGLTCLGIAFHSQKAWSKWLAPPGWLCVGIYFYLGSGHYFDIDDPVLIFMSIAALPVCIAYGGWEAILIRQERNLDSVDWLRGAVFWSAMPYLAIQHIPLLNVAIVWFTAWNTSIFLLWSGAADVHLGQMMVDLGGSAAPITWQEWDGSRWILTETLGENGFHVPMETADGESVDIGFILGCSALQSMIVFVGAIVAVRNVSWRRRIRAMALIIPLIHILNVFRNAGIIWLHIEYNEIWNLNGLSIFDFAHAYAAKFLSLGAMFLMAIVLFDLLPKLHRHVIDVLSPLFKILGEEHRIKSA